MLPAAGEQNWSSVLAHFRVSLLHPAFRHLPPMVPPAPAEHALDDASSAQFPASSSLSPVPVPCLQFSVPSSLSPVCCLQVPASSLSQFPAPSSLSPLPGQGTGTGNLGRELGQTGERELGTGNWRQGTGSRELAGRELGQQTFFSTSTDAVWAWCPGHH